MSTNNAVVSVFLSHAFKFNFHTIINSLCDLRWHGAVVSSVWAMRRQMVLWFRVLSHALKFNFYTYYLWLASSSVLWYRVFELRVDLVLRPQGFLSLAINLNFSFRLFLNLRFALVWCSGFSFEFRDWRFLSWSGVFDRTLIDAEEITYQTPKKSGYPLFDGTSSFTEIGL